MPSTAPRRLLVLHQGAIGDFVLTLSVLQAAGEYLRAACIDVVASAASARLAAGRSAVTSWRSPDAVGLHTLFGDGPLDTRLAELVGDSAWILSFLGGNDEPVRARLCGATEAEVISIDPRPTAETTKARRHITRQWAESIRRNGWGISEPGPPRILLPRNMDTGQCGAVILHPGSGGGAKCWPAENFIALADQLTSGRVEAGTAPISGVVWMLGPAEVESGRFDCIRGRAAAVGEELLIEDDLVRVAEHIASARLYVGNDAGLTHVAAALGTPTLAIFGPTDRQVWQPLGTHVLAVAPAQPGAPISEVRLQDVLAAVSILRARIRWPDPRRRQR